MLGNSSCNCVQNTIFFFHFLISPSSSAFPPSRQPNDLTRRPQLSPVLASTQREVHSCLAALLPPSLGEQPSSTLHKSDGGTVKFPSNNRSKRPFACPSSRAARRTTLNVAASREVTHWRLSGWCQPSRPHEAPSCLCPSLFQRPPQTGHRCEAAPAPASPPPSLNSHLCGR